MEHVETTHELPNNLRLLPGEKLQNVTEHQRRHGPAKLSSLKQMLRLTGASNSNEIGKFGPSVASLAFDAVKQPTPDHLRLYEVVFGRDSLRVAIDLLSSYPELARMTTLELARLQGTTYSTQREEEPGRIVHEARNKDDPIARDLSERLGWQWPYYGSVDATPEFIRTLSGYCNASDDNRGFLFQHYVNTDGEPRIMADALTGAVDWITRRLDSNDEGLLEFQSVLPRGIENQVWKDSWDAYHHSDGRLANHRRGIASIEVQVAAYDALLDGADLYQEHLNRASESEELRRRAGLLKQTIFNTFWTEEKGGYFVLGTDRDDNNKLRQLKLRTSNMGHVLNSRLLESDDADSIQKRDAVMHQLMSPSLLNVSGIRTLANDEVRFRPGSYHNGSVWLWDTHTIAKGMRRLGYGQQADELDKRILNVTEVTNSFPEYVRGDDSPTPSVNYHTIDILDSINQRSNRLEQPPQEVQAWTVAAILAIKKRMDRRGMFPDQQT